MNIFGFLFGCILLFFMKTDALAYTIVLDPGHGGENMGGMYEEYVERELTMKVARSMKAELEKYEDVTVYLTHTDIETDMSLEERVDYAVSKNADFLFCLHFNLSISHILFGSEVWVSSDPAMYAKEYPFASILMNEFVQMGLHDRGIKTRLNDKGIDYYGILRHATDNNLPCALIEHCHMDEERDAPFIGLDAKYEKFGVIDATAVAKYLGLKSKELDKDYDGYELPKIAVPLNRVKPDYTEPDYISIETKSLDKETGNYVFTLSATEYDSALCYYSVSTDGGETFSKLYPFPKEKDTIEVELTLEGGTFPQILCRVYNNYDLYGESNLLELESIPTREEEVTTPTEIKKEEDPDLSAYQMMDSATANKKSPNQNEELGMVYFLGVAAVVLASLLLTVLLCASMIERAKRKRRRRRKMQKPKAYWEEDHFL